MLPCCVLAFCAWSIADPRVARSPPRCVRAHSARDEQCQTPRVALLQPGFLLIGVRLGAFRSWPPCPGVAGSSVVRDQDDGAGGGRDRRHRGADEGGSPVVRPHQRNHQHAEPVQRIHTHRGPQDTRCRRSQQSRPLSELPTCQHPDDGVGWGAFTTGKATRQGVRQEERGRAYGSRQTAESSNPNEPSVSGTRIGELMSHADFPAGCWASSVR